MSKDCDQGPDEKSASAWRLVLPGPPAAEACPSENELTGYLEGALKPSESATIEAHLETCSDCLEIVGVAAAAVADGPEARVQDRAPSADDRRRRRRAVVAAALIALAGLVGLGVHRLLSKESGPKVDPPPSWYSTLRDAARGLSATAPESLADLVAYRPDELAALGLGVTRTSDAFWLQAPREVVLEQRPDFRVQLPRGVESVHLLLEDAAGSMVFDLHPNVADLVVAPPPRDGVPEVAVLAYPAAARSLESGDSFVVTITISTPLGKSEASAAFRLATRDAAASWRRAVAALEESGLGLTAVLLRGHLALRRGFLDEAESAAREALNIDPANGAARDLQRGVMLRRR